MRRLLLYSTIIFFSVFVCSQFEILAKPETPVTLLNEQKTLQNAISKRSVPQKWNGQVRKIVYLTIDDGPSKNTEAILDILNQYNVKATFFFIGTNVQRRPELVEKVNSGEHYIGLHTMSHDRKIIYNESKPEALSNELIELQGLINGIVDKEPNLLRPPYGSKPGIKPAIAESLVNNNFKVWDWTVDTLDWRSKSVAEIMEKVETQTNEPVEVLLMHEKDISVEALPHIIEFYLKNGYEFRPYNPDNHFTVNFLRDSRL